MKIPKNMKEEEVIDVIENVINKISPKYTFKDYDLEDIKQESFIICIDALNRYDGKRPLENFLSVHLSNRLKNFIRDNHYVKDNIHKKKIKAPQYIIDDNYINTDYDLESEIINKEIFDKIDEELPASLREDYLKILNNISITKQRKEKLFDTIKRILTDEKG
jgi:RNA polymerase sigma factor (sigma-70 family)